jgi:hypothetical protein
MTGSYRWLKDRSPSDLPLAEAPSDPAAADAARPIETRCRFCQHANPVDDAERARSVTSINISMLPITDDYDEWVKVGMALHSIGDDSLLA